MVKKFVVDSADLKCSLGTKPGKLIIPMPRKEKLNDKAVANILDCKPLNIPPGSFALCKKTSPPKPCTPACIKWVSGKCNAKAAGQDALLDDSIVACLAGGGKIEITDCGQGFPLLGVTDAEGCEYVLIPDENYSGKPIPIWMLGKLLGINLDCYLFGGDPVNMATGNFVYKKEYLNSKGLFPMSLGIFYNSQDKRKNALGHGWLHSFEISVVKEGQKATISFEDGKEEIFFSDRHGNYIHSQGKDNKLSEKDGKYIYKTHERLIYIFDSSGKLCRKEDINDNFIELSYNGQNRLSKVENNSGTAFEFSYECKKLKKVSDNADRVIIFDYLGDTLTGVTDEQGNKYQFDYDSQNRIIKIVNSLGIESLKNGYDDKQRIKRQEFPDGGILSYKYNDAEKKLTLTEQNGNEITYVHDDQLRNVATIYSDGTEKFTYNAQNLRTQYTDKMGNVTKHSYDDRTNLVKSVNPIGEITNFEYNDLNKQVKRQNFL